MSIEATITTLLRTPMGATNRVTPGTELVMLNDGILPRCVYTLISLSRDYDDDGSGLVKALFQLDIYAKTLAEARTKADAIRIELDGYKSSADPTPILRIYFTDEQFIAGTQLPGSQQTIARFQMDMNVDYIEAQP